MAKAKKKTQNQTSKLWEKTKNGIRKYKPTGQYHMNKWHKGRAIQGPTGQTKPAQALMYLNAYLVRYDAGLPLTDIEVVISEKTSVQSEDQRPSSDSELPKPTVTVEAAKPEKSFTWHDAIGRLAITIAEKKEEDRITSERSVGYRDECVRAIERNYPGDITKRDMSSFKGKEGVAELEAFRKKMFPPRYSRSRYNGLMQNLRAVFEEAVAEGVLEANPCDHPKFKFVTLIVPPKKLKSVLLTDDGYEQLFQEIKETNGEHTYEAVRFLSLCGSRIDCARKMLKSDVNLDEDSLTFRREIIKGGMKPTGKDVVFPFYPELRDCAKKLLTFDHRDEYLFPVYDVRKQMKAACKKLGLKHQTPHLLRHVFGTRLVSAENQQHLSIADAAELMCHRDGGKLMLTRYVHVSPSLRTSIQNIRIMRRSSEKPAAPTRKAA